MLNNTPTVHSDSKPLALGIAKTVNGHPGYAQRLCSHIFDTLEQFLHQAQPDKALCNGLVEQKDRWIIDLLGGPQGTELLQIAHTVDVFSRYGIIFMLFLVGLETNIGEMLKVGGDSIRVALIGIVLPFVLGVAASYAFTADVSLHTALFLGAALSATSVGITARVLSDIRRLDTPEGVTILGGAVVDDVLGILVLAIVVGIADAASNGGSVSAAAIGVTAAKAFGMWT